MLYEVITIARKSVMESGVSSWTLREIVCLYAGGCYIVGTIFINKEKENIVVKM